MTNDEIHEVYEELTGMFVAIDPDASRGLDYVRDRLMFCRAMQDRVGEVQLRVNRELSQVLEQQLLLEYEQVLQPDAPKKGRLVELARQVSVLTFLVRGIKTQATLLNRSAMDIRLLADLTKEQIKNGEIDPKAAGLVREQTPGDITPAPVTATNHPGFTAPVRMETTATTLGGFVPSRGYAPVQPTTFADPTVASIPQTPVAVTEAVSFESLFPQEPSHASSTTGSPF